MYQKEIKNNNSIMYVYQVASLDKKKMLGFIRDILIDNDITDHGFIITEAKPDKEWTGIPLEVPSVPIRQIFIDTYSKIDFVSLTSIMEYHGKTIMMSYRPYQEELAIIIPEEAGVSIDEIEKNVIPDVIDHNPEK